MECLRLGQVGLIVSRQGENEFRQVLTGLG